MLITAGRRFESYSGSHFSFPEFLFLWCGLACLPFPHIISDTGSLAFCGLRNRRRAFRHTSSPFLTFKVCRIVLDKHAVRFGNQRAYLRPVFFDVESRSPFEVISALLAGQGFGSVRCRAALSASERLAPRPGGGFFFFWGGAPLAAFFFFKKPKRAPFGGGAPRLFARFCGCPGDIAGGLLR